MPLVVTSSKVPAKTGVENARAAVAAINQVRMHSSFTGLVISRRDSL